MIGNNKKEQVLGKRKVIHLNPRKSINIYWTIWKDHSKYIYLRVYSKIQMFIVVKVHKSVEDGFLWKRQKRQKIRVREQNLNGWLGSLFEFQWNREIIHGLIDIQTEHEYTLLHGYKIAHPPPLGIATKIKVNNLLTYLLTYLFINIIIIIINVIIQPPSHLQVII